MRNINQGYTPSKNKSNKPPGYKIENIMEKEIREAAENWAEKNRINFTYPNSTVLTNKEVDKEVVDTARHSFTTGAQWALSQQPKPLKSLSECKDEVAKKYGMNTWDGMCFAFAGFIKMIEPYMNEAAELYASQQHSTELQELREWKKQALEVMPDFQKIGELIGVKLGDTVHDKIVPYLEKITDFKWHEKDSKEGIRILDEVPNDLIMALFDNGETRRYEDDNFPFAVVTHVCECPHLNRNIIVAERY